VRPLKQKEIGMRRQRGPRGFTIIELLMVMVIVAVMVAIVVPRTRVSPKMYVRMAARQLLRDAELTRNRALALKRVVRVQFVAGTNTYACYGDDNGDGTIAGTTAEIVFLHVGTRAFANGVTFGRGNATAGIPGETGSGAVTFTNTRIDFDTRGLPSPFGTKGTVYLTATGSPSSVFAVQMTAAGSFRLWTYLPNGTWQ
jgi:prepilin-type N-terminal cleavage/methylation domain-containing protein